MRKRFWLGLFGRDLSSSLAGSRGVGVELPRSQDTPHSREFVTWSRRPDQKNPIRDGLSDNSTTQDCDLFGRRRATGPVALSKTRSPHGESTQQMPTITRTCPSLGVRPNGLPRWLQCGLRKFADGSIDGGRDGHRDPRRRRRYVVAVERWNQLKRQRPRWLEPKRDELHSYERWRRWGGGRFRPGWWCLGDRRSESRQLIHFCRRRRHGAGRSRAGWGDDGHRWQVTRRRINGNGRQGAGWRINGDGW